MSRRAPSVVVRQPEPPEEPIPTEVLAESIRDIAEGMRRIDSGRLNRKALVLLISAQSGIGRGAVEVVLNVLAELDKIYLKPEAK